MDISLVTYRSAPHLPALLRSLAAQVNALRPQLWIYDNASDDDTLETLARELAKYPNAFTTHLTRGTKNIGFGAAHNHNAALGTSTTLLILNPDCVLPDDTLARLHALPQQSPAEIAAWEMRQRPYEHPKPYDPLTGETPWCSAACLLIRRTAFENVKGFDPAFFLYGEDVDLSFRLRASGYKLRYEPGITITHHSYRTPGEVKPAAFFGAVRAMLLLRTRYGTPLHRLTAPCLWLAAFLMPSYPIPGRIPGLWHAMRDVLRHRRLTRIPLTPPPAFHRLDVTPRRTGAFHDIGPGLDTPTLSLTAACPPEALETVTRHLTSQRIPITPHPVAWPDLPNWLKTQKADWFWWLDPSSLPFPDMAEQMAALTRHTTAPAILCDAQTITPSPHGTAYATPKHTHLAETLAKNHPPSACWFRRSWLLSLPDWPSTPSLLLHRVLKQDKPLLTLPKTLLWRAGNRGFCLQQPSVNVLKA